MKSYLEFNQVINVGKKTKLFHIFNKITGEFIGLIKWSGSWRQYVSAIETLENEKMEFSAGCHREVAEFIDELMNEKKKVEDK